MGKSSSAPSPDPQIGKAAMKNAEIGENWLAFSKEAYKDAQNRQVGIDALNTRVTNQQIAAQDKANKWADEAHARQIGVFQPEQDKFIAKANSWDSVGSQAKAAAEAKADVMNNSAFQNGQIARQAAANGISPTSGRYAGVTRAAGTQTALAAAGAQNNARSVLRNQAMALQGSAVNMGNGLAANAATDLGLSNSSGSAASSATMAGGQLANSSASIMGQGYQGAMQGYSNQANILNQQYQNQLSAWNAENQANSGLMSGIGSIIGLTKGFGLFSSDENVKEDKRPVKGVLDAVNKMRVEAWKYKDGEGDGGGTDHVGTYAQDFQKQTGLGDGKTINVIDALGVTMGAVQELSKKVDKIGGSKSIRRAA